MVFIIRLAARTGCKRTVRMFTKRIESRGHGVRQQSVIGRKKNQVATVAKPLSRILPCRQSATLGRNETNPGEAPGDDFILENVRNDYDFQVGIALRLHTLKRLAKEFCLSWAGDNDGHEVRACRARSALTPASP